MHSLSTYIIFVIITFYKVEIIVNKGRTYIFLLRNECGYGVFFLLSSIVLFDMQNSDLGKKYAKKKINNTRYLAAHGKVRKYKWKLNSSYCRRDWTQTDWFWHAKQTLARRLVFFLIADAVMDKVSN